MPAEGIDVEKLFLSFGGLQALADDWEPAFSRLVMYGGFQGSSFDYGDGDAVECRGAGKRSLCFASLTMRLPPLPSAVTSARRSH